MESCSCRHQLQYSWDTQSRMRRYALGSSFYQDVRKAPLNRQKQISQTKHIQINVYLFHTWQIETSLLMDTFWACRYYQVPCSWNTVCHPDAHVICKIYGNLISFLIFLHAFYKNGTFKRILTRFFINILLLNIGKSSLG